MWLKGLSGVLFLILLVVDPARGQTRTNCSCGLTNPTRPKITGGNQAGVNEFTYMALVLLNEYDGSSFCGGSIITAYHVLTAAHCTYQLRASQIDIVVGEHNRIREGDTPFEKTIKAARVRNHPSYNSETVKHDIAIITTRMSIPFSEAVGPVCLPVKQTDIIGEVVQVTGWGMTSRFGRASDVLMKLDMNIVPFADCQETYGRRGLNSSTQLCTFRTCTQCSHSGDSGSPLALRDPSANVMVQVGVVSYGSYARPGVETDVRAYLPWIQRQISETAHLTKSSRQNTCSIVEDSSYSSV